MTPNARSLEATRVKERGFTLLELLIAMAAFAMAVVPMLYVASAGQRLARSQPEASDLQQRVRVVADKLQRDLAMAGAGPLHGSLAGRLSELVPAIVPARTGLRSPDAMLSAFDDRLTVVYVPDAATSVPLATAMANPSANLAIDPSSPGCDSSGGVCGLVEGTRALIVDSGHVGDGYEIFTVTDATGTLSHGSPNQPFTRAYGVGAVVVPIVQRVYHFDRAGRHLMLYDGYQSDMPLIDDVVEMRFAYFAESPDVGLVQVPLEQLTDGPLVGVSPNEFDRTLLDIRVVRVTLRLEAAAEDVRGAGVGFRRPGRSNSAFSYVPDHEVTFDVALRNVGGVP
jgi:prepilin-type N-terminal cleavage/methylation domain-containing protein